MTFKDEVDEYLHRTGMFSTHLAEKATGDTSAYQRLKNGVTPRQRTIDKFRQFMTDHPDGVLPPPKPEFKYKNPRDAFRIRKKVQYVQTASIAPYMTTPRKPNVDETQLVRVDRDPCEYCATRRDYGCRHYPLQRTASY